MKMTRLKQVLNTSKSLKKIPVKKVMCGIVLVMIFMMPVIGLAQVVETGSRRELFVDRYMTESLDDVNTTNIKDAIRLGCHTMQNVFNEGDNNIPFMDSSVWPNAGLYFSQAHSESHVPGRHLNALLNAEEAAGILIDPEAIDKHTMAAFFSYSGPLQLPLNRQEVGGPHINFSPHNIREGFHALYSLVKFRQNEQARELAENSINCIIELWDPVQGWNLDAIENNYNLHYQKCLSFVHGLGRSLGPLVKYYDVTRSPKALYLAILIKDKLIKEYYQSEGNYDAPLFGKHSHSVTCCLSSLAQMAELTNDFSVKNKFINKLHQCKSRNFRKDSGFESLKRFRIISSDQELIA